MLLALRSLWENAVSVVGGAVRKKRRKPRRVYQPLAIPQRVDVVIQGISAVASSPAAGVGELDIGVELYDYEILALMAAVPEDPFPATRSTAALDITTNGDLSGHELAALLMGAGRRVTRIPRITERHFQVEL